MSYALPPLENPLVTIITPSFNQGKFIQQTIDSVLDQSYSRIEYLVIDGGSTDDTLAILNSYGSRLSFISEKDNGQAQALNKGLRMSKGDIIGFLNSDDYLLHDAIQNVVDVFQGTKKGWVTGDYVIINEDGRNIHSFILYYKKMLRSFASKTIFEITNFIAQPSTFWRRGFLNRAGEFNESLRFVMDYDYWMRLYNISSPAIITDKLSCFRIHKSSKGGSEFVLQFDEEIVVLKDHQVSRLIIWCHQIHNEVIKMVYRLIK